MKDNELAAVAREEFERVEGPYGGNAYRCGAVLSDGTHLPCVLLASLESVVSLAVRRFEESRNDDLLPEDQRRFGAGFQYADIVRVFVSSGNRLSGHDIARLEQSPYALPLARLREVRGETRMGWTEFAGVMRDGNEFGFGTAYSMDFFHMPEGYRGEDVVEIISHKRVDPLYRERPFFTCWVEGL